MKRLLQNEWFVLLAIILAAALIRFYQLDTLPTGLYHDEAVNGIDALSVLDGDHPLYFEANNGREPLYIYLIALSIRLLGATPAAIRLVSALLGTLFIPCVYWLGRELANRRVATYAALLATSSVWAINLSRVGFRAIAYLPIITSALALLVHSQKKRSLWAALGGGVLLGLSLYTYLSARVGIVALCLILLYLLIWHRQETWRGLLIACLSAIIIFAPLGIYFVTHWQETFGRAGQVSILNPAIGNGQPLAMLGQNLLKTALAFFWQGDFIPRHNVPLRPVFDPLIAICFALGIIVLLRRFRRNPQGAIVLIWFAIMLVPTVIAEDAPHFLRASGVLPVLYLLPAYGLDTLVRRLDEMRLMRGTAVGIIAVSATLSLTAYLPHLQSETVYYQFESAATELAVGVNQYLGIGWQGEGYSVSNDKPESERLVYIAPRFYDSWQSITYLTDAAQKAGFITNNPQELTNAKDAMMVFWPYESWQELMTYLPENRLITVSEGGYEQGDLETESRLLNVSISTSAIETPDNLQATFEDGIELVGYSCETIDDQLIVRLYWHCTQSLGSSLNVFVHVLESDSILVQDDGPLALGYYGTELWRSGDVVEDVHRLTLDPDQTLDNLILRVGLYHWDTLERLAVAYDDTEATAVDIPLQGLNP